MRHVPPPHHQNHRTVRTPQTPRLWARPSTCSPAVPSHTSTSPTGPRPPASPGFPLPADPYLARHVPQAPGPSLLATTTQHLSLCVGSRSIKTPAEPHARVAPRPRLRTLWEPHPRRVRLRAPPPLNSWSSPASLLGLERSPVMAAPSSSARAPSAKLSLFSPSHTQLIRQLRPELHRLLIPDRCRHPEPSLYQATLITALTSQLNTWCPLLPPSRAHSQHSSRNNPCHSNSDGVPPVPRLL